MSRKPIVYCPGGGKPGTKSPEWPLMVVCSACGNAYAPNRHTGNVPAHAANSAYIAKVRAEEAVHAAAEEARAPAWQELVAAAVNLLTYGRLSTSSGGDPGMIFDQFDAEVESRRRGTVTFDRDAVDRLDRAYRAYHGHPPRALPDASEACSGSGKPGRPLTPSVATDGKPAYHCVGCRGWWTGPQETAPAHIARMSQIK